MASDTESGENSQSAHNNHNAERNSTDTHPPHTETTPLLSGDANGDGIRSRTHSRDALDPEVRLSPEDFDHSSTFAISSTRGLLLVFLVLSFLWLILLTVDFFTDAWFVKTHASGFLEFDMCVLIIIALALSLGLTKGKTALSSGITRGDQIVGYITIGVYMVSWIIILSSPHLRHRHIYGIANVMAMLGGLVCLILVPFSERVVALSRPRVAQRRSMVTWLNVTVTFLLKTILLCLFILFAVGLMADLFISARDKFPGNMVPVQADKYRNRYDVHIYCTERSSPSHGPTVLVEAGEASSEETASWILDLQRSNRIPQVCFWDRPGLGHSDNAPSPFSMGMAADVLAEALHQQGVFGSTSANKSLILVAHGVGGLYSRIFAARHSDYIHSIMFVDALHEDLFYRRETAWYGFRTFLRGILSPITGPLFGGYSGRFFKAKLQEQLVARSMSKTEIISSNALLPAKLPTLVISSSKSIRKDAEWSDKQRQLTKLTDKNMAWEIIEGPHRLWENARARDDLQRFLLDLYDYA